MQRMFVILDNNIIMLHLYTIIIIAFFFLSTYCLQKIVDIYILQEAELWVTNIKMSKGITRVDRLKNEYTGGTGHVRSSGDKAREVWLLWFGHVHWKDTEKICKNMLRMELPGRRLGRIPKAVCN